MRRPLRLWIALPIVFLTLLSCQAVTRGVDRLLAGEAGAPRPTSTQTRALPSPDQAAGTPAPAASPSVAAPAQPGAETSGEQAASERGFETSLHPDGELYVGDLVSFEILALDDSLGKDLQAEVRFPTDEGEQMEIAKFDRYGIAGRNQATFYWVWDTAGLEAGEYPITYTIRPEGLSWNESVTLLPEGSLPPSEREASWASTVISPTDGSQAPGGCCTLHYISGTAAQRDMDDLAELAETLAVQVSANLGGQFKEPVSIVLLPRLLGHGGFTAQDISLSYLDRNYAGSSPEIVLKHELVHALDEQLGGELRPTLLLEGLAVYLSGGHFKPEPLMPRAAVLLEMGSYLQLPELADNFYPSQHEIGYLEAGALVEYMVKTWGWQAFSEFYRDIHPAPESGDQTERWGQSKALDAALQEHFEITLAELDERFRQALGEEEVTQALRQDVRLSIRQYDAVRRYQQLLDQSAYFMTAWLPDVKTMREKGIVADYLRHPAAEDNLVLEVMLVTADAALRSGDYPEAERHLDSIEAILAAVESSLEDPLAVDSLSADYTAVVQALLAEGYEPQQVTLNENTALALAVPEGGMQGGGPYLQELELVRSGAIWQLPQKVNQGGHENRALNGPVQYRFR
jgi:hypothetical protein